MRKARAQQESVLEAMERLQFAGAAAVPSDVDISRIGRSRALVAAMIKKYPSDVGTPWEAACCLSEFGPDLDPAFDRYRRTLADNEFSRQTFAGIAIWIFKHFLPLKNYVAIS